MENLKNEKQSGDCKSCNSQIAEMAKAIDEYTEPLSARDIHKADFAERFAEHLYNEGFCKQSEWISVDERLPEENERYLACVKIAHLAFDITMVVIVGYNKIHGFDVISGEETVTHWMPLPEAPKMKGGAGE